MPDAIDLRPQNQRGRHINKKLVYVGLAFVAVATIWILLPGTSQKSDKPKAEGNAWIARMVKPSKALQQMRGGYEGEPLNGQPQVVPAPSPAPPIDKSEEERLRKENERLRELLNRVPKPETKPVQDHGEAKRLAEERKKREQEKRKLSVWRAPESKDSQQILQVKYPPSPYSLSPNWRIPCITEGPVSNEVPGSFGVRVRQAVYDSATGRHVVIPQEASMVMAPRQAVLYGDGRLGVSVQTLVFPDASYVQFKGGTGTDQEGHNGFSDRVDRRWGSLFASILLSAVLRQGTTVAGGSYGDPASRFANSVGAEASQQGQKEVRQALRTDPILTIRAGYECTIFLEEPLNLTRVWP